jgi:hypothetical protein
MERPYSGHCSGTRRRGFPDFAIFFFSTALGLFSITPLLREETKIKLPLKLFRDREHIGMSHIFLRTRFRETLTDATLNSACGEKFPQYLPRVERPQKAPRRNLSYFLTTS